MTLKILLSCLAKINNLHVFEIIIASIQLNDRFQSYIKAFLHATIDIWIVFQVNLSLRFYLIISFIHDFFKSLQLFTLSINKFVIIAYILVPLLNLSALLKVIGDSQPLDLCFSWLIIVSHISFYFLSKAFTKILTKRLHNF